MEKSSGIYKLIEFATDRCKGRSVDIVPSKWITYDLEGGHLKTIFMPPPYTTETAEILHSLVKSRVVPPKSWTSYDVKILGDASKFSLSHNSMIKFMLR